MEINERVLFLREKILKMTQKEFGAAIGIKGAAVSRIERGVNSLTEGRAMLICSKFGVHFDWLWYNKGEIFEGQHETSDFIQKYESLDPQLREFLDVVLEAVIKNQGKLLK